MGAPQHFRRFSLAPLLLLAGMTLGMVNSAGQPVTASHQVPRAAEAVPVSKAQAESAALKQEALSVARSVADAYPDDAFAYALLGSAYYNDGRSEEATKFLRKCLDLRPDQAEPYEILARVAYDKGNLEESIGLCRESLKRAPGNPEVLNQLGRSLMDLGRPEEAIQALQQATALQNPLSQSFYLLGQANLQSGKHAEAKADFQRAIALMPDHTQAFFGLFTSCVRLGQTDEAERYREQFQKLEAVDRRSLVDRSAQEDTLTGLPMVQKTVARTFFGAGQLYQVHGQGAKSAALLLNAARLDEGALAYRAVLEANYVQRQALAEGVKAFESLVAEQPSNHLNYLYLGRLQARLDNVAAAEQAYRKVLELAPQWAAGYRVLAELYLRGTARVSEALPMARRAVELDPSGPHYALLAQAYFRSGDRVGAIEAMKKAIAASPDEKRYQAVLEQLKRNP